MIDILIMQLIAEKLKKKAAQLQANQEIESYKTPAYLENAAVGPERGTHLSAPGSVLNPSASAAPGEKLGSIAPTPIAFKKDPVSTPAVPLVRMCSLCNGFVKDGECGTCGGRRCPACGEMNYATSTSCLNCRHAF